MLLDNQLTFQEGYLVKVHKMLLNMLILFYLNRILYFYKELQVILLGDLNL